MIMSSFSVDPLKENSLMYLYAIRDEIDFDPAYQRQGDIWPASKRRLLIDSLLNGFDLPKIYFHEVNQKKAGKPVKYAVIDGKQRLEAVFAFLDSEFPVPDLNEFSDIQSPFSQFSGKYYKDFALISLKLKARFESLPLPVYVVRTSEPELIEEMFSRLNEASPLNAPEKRNALGGPAPVAIRKISAHPFFQKHIPFENRRYKHYDIAAKLLLLTEGGKITDTKKIHLDRFVRQYIDKPEAALSPVVDNCTQVIELMCDVFLQKDALLRLTTMIPIYYCTAMALSKRGQQNLLTRDALLKFDEARRQNRKLAQDQEESPEINFDWLEFDRLVQTPNDSSAIEFKVNVLLDYLGADLINSKTIQ